MNSDSRGEAGDEELFEISNIPSELRSADLRAFFSEWVEGGRFLCFHYTHRRGVCEAQSGGNKRCCLVKVRPSDGGDLVARFSGQRWIQAKRVVGDTELAERCLVSPALMTAPAAGDSIGEGYMTRKQRREMRRKGLSKVRNTVVFKDLLPPPAMPQGNVGTPSRRLIELVRECLVPAGALKGLGLCLSGCGRTKERRGEFNFNWTSVVGESDEDDDAEEWDRLEALEGPVPNHINERADRLECETTLFEEECEQTWEKGSSGLVFHTDDAYWDAAKGDFHERTADALDVVPEDDDVQGDWEASTKDPDADAFQESLRRVIMVPGRTRRNSEGPAKPKPLKLPPAIRARKADRRDGDGCCTDSLAAALAGCPSRVESDVHLSKSVRKDETARPLSVEVTVSDSRATRSAREDAFERDVHSGFAGKLCRKMGWRPGTGLGVKGDLGIVEGLVKSWEAMKGAGMPVKNVKERRRGIGFGGRREGDSSKSCDSDSDTPSAPAELDEGAGAGSHAKPGCTPRGGGRSRETETAKKGDDAAVQLAFVDQVDEDYLRIGCIYDEDAMTLRKIQEERVSRAGRPWLGAFSARSMEQEGTVEDGVPWWDEGGGEGSSVGWSALDAKRQRLMRAQLESVVFKCENGGHGRRKQARGVVGDVR